MKKIKWTYISKNSKGKLQEEDLDKALKQRNSVNFVCSKTDGISSVKNRFLTKKKSLPPLLQLLLTTNIYTKKENLFTTTDKKLLKKQAKIQPRGSICGSKNSGGFL